MVSVCCEDCRTEKLKSNLLNKILLKEHCNIIRGYLGCDTCIKMKPILDDPIYQTLNPEQQQIYKVIKLFPLPNDIDDFKLVFKYDGKDYLTKHIKQMKKRNFGKVQDLYDNLYVEKYYDKKYYFCDFGIRHGNPERILFDIIFRFMVNSYEKCSFKHMVNISFNDIADDILDISGADGYGWDYLEIG